MSYQEEIQKQLANRVRDMAGKIAGLEAENQKLREQRDAANAHIQLLNRIIAGDAE